MNKIWEAGRLDIMWWEYLPRLEIWILLLTTDGHPRRDFWKGKKNVRFNGVPFCFDNIMSYWRFQEIIIVHQTYNTEYSPHKDRFHLAREFLNALNKSMDENFIPSWIICMDKIMSKWINMWSCPGFVFCPRKPWPQGNEYHTIVCGETLIIFRVELVEENNRLDELGKKSYEEHSRKTVKLLLRTT